MKKAFRLIGVIIAVALLVSMMSCNGKDVESAVSSESSEDAVSGVSSKEPEFEPIYFDTDVWQAVPLVTKGMLEDGIKGGEGCQAVIYFTYAPDGKTMLMGTDVGGMYKSVDGGDSWYAASIGIQSAGAVGMAFDPNNQKRVLCIGANSSVHEANGIYLSTDTGDSWTYVYKKAACNYRNPKSQVAWDASSYDEELGGSKIAYWSREKTSDNDADSLIYRSVTGGDKWQAIKNSGEYADGYIFVNKNSGAVAAGNANGVFISNDRGESFEKVLDAEVLSMDYVMTEPNSLYATIFNKDNSCYQLAVSKNFGKHWTFTNLNMSLPTYLRVSPVNTNRMILMDDTISKSGQYPGYVYSTDDGGENWYKAVRNEAYSAVPANSDNVKFAWSPTEEKTVVASWCFMCKSTDGGITFKWSNTGYNGICVGEMNNFNVNNSDLIYYASQDYNGAFSTDGGKSWKYMRWDGKGWGGWTYGGYVINKNTVVTGVAQSMFGETEMWITYDGGETFQSLGLKINGNDIGCGIVGNDKIAFFGEYRTADGGRTWKKMDGCMGVYTVDYSGSGAVFGLNGNNVVVSTDTGLTWKTVASVDGARDVAYNYKSDELLVAGGYNAYNNPDGQLYKCKVDDNFNAVGQLQACEINQRGINLVAVDPKNPDIIYAGARNDYYFNIRSIWRSLDGGENWTVLTRTLNDGRTGPDGGKNPTCIRVNANTGELFVFTGCRGVWKMAAPPKEYYN